MARAAESGPRTSEAVELTILMPCLNEAETVATCVTTALAWLAEHGVEGEVVVADNGSTDGSRELAADAGARVVPVARRGYGAALTGGIEAARGSVHRDGRRRRVLRLRCAGRLRRATARRCRPRDGQPLRGRHRAGCDAAAPPLPGQPGAVVGRTAAVPHPGQGLPLRPAGLPPRPDARPRPAHLGDGVRQRDGGQGRAARLRHPRGADRAAPGRPHPPAAPAHVARRLAPPAVPPALQPAVAVPDPRLHPVRRSGWGSLPRSWWDRSRSAGARST